MRIADSGFLVALLYTRDKYHTWALRQMDGVQSPLVTCESVLTETAHIVSQKGIPQLRVSHMVFSGAVSIAFQIDDEIDRVDHLMNQYADRPMDLADACVVRMSELYPRADVLTVDDDFHIYRRNGNGAIPVVMPSV